jgi:hypothetical protein
VIVWFGFSDEGQLFSFDTEGVMRSFSFVSEQWTPSLDFKNRFNDIFSSLWIVGVSEQEVLAIKMLADHQAPMVTQKGEIRRFQLRVPLLN